MAASKQIYNKTMQRSRKAQIHEPATQLEKTEEKGRKMAQNKYHQTRSVQGRKKTGGFTLIEMIGVLAVIAILAAVLIPQGVRGH